MNRTCVHIEEWEGQVFVYFPDLPLMTTDLLRADNLTPFAKRLIQQLRKRRWLIFPSPLENLELNSATPERIALTLDKSWSMKWLEHRIRRATASFGFIPDFDPS